MVNKVILLLCVMFLFSCANKEQKPPSPPPPLVEVTGKLEKLLSLPQDTVLEFYDLSGDFIMDFPDLSAYTIKSLNLSHNYIDTLILDFLPQELDVLNLSYNYLKDLPRELIALKGLKDLNFSHNKIKEFFIGFFIDRVDFSYNNLSYFYLGWSYNYYYGYTKKKLLKNMSYLNISNNPNLSNEVWFVPSMIDTIIRDNIANDKELQMIDWRLKKMRGLIEVKTKSKH